MVLVGSISPPRAVIVTAGALSITLLALVVTDRARADSVAVVMIVYATAVSREISRRAGHPAPRRT